MLFFWFCEIKYSLYFLTVSIKYFFIAEDISSGVFNFNIFSFPLKTSDLYRFGYINVTLSHPIHLNVICFGESIGLSDVVKFIHGICAVSHVFVEVGIICSF